MKQIKRVSTEEKDKNLKILKLTQILERKAFKTPFTILQIYTAIKWKFSKTTEFENSEKRENKKRQFVHHSESSPNIQRKSLKLAVQEVQIKNYTERSLDHPIQTAGIQQLVEMARETRNKREELKKVDVQKRDIYQNIYEISLLLVLIGFLLSIFLVIKQHLTQQI